MITLRSAGLYFDVSLTYIIEPRLKTGRNNKSRADQQLRGAGEDRDKFLSTRCNKTTFDIAISEVRSKIAAAAAILPYKASLEPSKVHSTLGALINELK